MADFLAPLNWAGLQVGVTIFLLVVAIIMLSKSTIGNDILNGILKEVQHDGTLKFSMARFLLLFVIIIWATMILSFKDAAYTKLLDDANFKSTVDMIEGYAYKVVDFFLGLIFGNKVVTGMVSIFKKGDSTNPVPDKSEGS